MGLNVPILGIGVLTELVGVLEITYGGKARNHCGHKQSGDGQVFEQPTRRSQTDEILGTIRRAWARDHEGRTALYAGV